MLKIRDLAINTISPDRPKGEYQMCQRTAGGPGGPVPKPKKKEKTKKKAGELQQDAVMELREQLQQRINRQLHD
ncbi:MAG TPA: hypothetical protein VG323_07055 [Thermoanaerobaculia bacterium]|nr:hypothetical protein [Thermoanaerobaculia bacterium]